MSDKTKELDSSNGETKKSAGKFCFSLNSKTTSQPKSEPETTKNSQPKTDTASLLASLEAKQAASKKSDEDSNSGNSDPLKNIKPLKLKLTSAPKLAGVKRPAQEAKKISLADIFNPDEPPEEEEMPPEAKMRMRNIGKDTPTASGPNSFNKGKLGFCNQAKMFEKQLKMTFEEPERSKRKLY